MVWLRRLEAIVRSWLGRPHPEPAGVRALVYHQHLWDHCRDYGQYRYKICLRCGIKRAC